MAEFSSYEQPLWCAGQFKFQLRNIFFHTHNISLKFGQCPKVNILTGFKNTTESKLVQALSQPLTTQLDRHWLACRRVLVRRVSQPSCQEAGTSWALVLWLQLVIVLDIEVASVINWRGRARWHLVFQIYLSAIDTLVTGMVLDSETFSILFANCVPFFQLFKILAPGIVTFMSEYNEWNHNRYL